MCATKAGLAAQRDWLQNEQIFLDRFSLGKPSIARWDSKTVPLIHGF